ncbi:hypothetical protein BVI2075_60001 [Burkholderia vietnamiensis]|nr:hypothetical protein BVI2075_60001 [Burkholderia vietnamiensis]
MSVKECCESCTATSGPVMEPPQPCGGSRRPQSRAGVESKRIFNGAAAACRGAGPTDIEELLRSIARERYGRYVRNVRYGRRYGAVTRSTMRARRGAAPHRRTGQQRHTAPPDASHVGQAFAPPAESNGST